MKKITKLLMIACVAVFSWHGYAQNGGDDCATAVVALEGAFTGTQINDASGGANGGDSAWFVYTATADGLLNVNSCSGGADTRLFIFDSCGGVTLANNDDAASCPVNTDGTGSNFASRIDGLAVTTGTDYFIQWDDRWSDGPFNWSITLVTCANPTGITATATGTTTADASWTAGAIGATSADWEVVPTGNGQGVGVVASGNEAGTTVAITGLTQNTTYDFFIKSDCETVYEGPVTFTTEADCLGVTGLTETNVDATSTNITFTDNNAVAPAGGWDYELLDITAGQAPGSGITGNVTTETINLTGLTDGGNNYEIIITADCGASASPSASISWVQGTTPGITCLDAVVATEGTITGTQIFDASGGANGGDSAWFVYTATADGVINVNSCSGGSDTRLFIWNDCADAAAAATSDDEASCPVNTDGTGSNFASRIDAFAVVSGEDYYIQWDDRWSDGPFNWSITLTSCFNPDDAAVSPTGPSTADATWTAAIGAASYDWEVVPTGNAQGVGVVTSGNETGTSVSITGLTELTTYDFFIKSDCETVYAGPITFTSLANCSFPINPTVTGVTADLATIGWTDANMPPSASFDYEVVDVTGGGAPTGIPTGSGITAASVDLTGLIVGNNYQFLVRSICPSGLTTVTSDWSPAFDWIQLEAPGCASNFMPVNMATVDPGNVATSWDAPTTGGTAAEYDFYFGTDPAALTLLGTVPGTTATISGVAAETTLFWQVVPSNAAGDATGCPINQFTTAPLDAGGIDCATAVAVVDGTYTSQIIDTGGGTQTPDSQWFSYTATASGSLDVNSCNGGSDTRLSIWNDCTDVTFAFQNDDACATGLGSDFASQLVIDIVAGEDYFIQWDDRWNEGVFVWNINLTAACPGGVTTWDGTAWDNGVPDNTMEAVIDGPYDTATADLDVCVLTVKSTLTVAANSFARADGDINVTAAGTMDVVHTGSVLQVDGTATTNNDGAINVNLTTPMLDARDFMLIGSPMTTADRADFAGFRMLSHDTSAFDMFIDPSLTDATNFVDLDNNDWSTHTGTLNPGEGYMYWGGADINAAGMYDIVYSNGTLNNGDIVYGTTFGTDKNDSPNILANPYASAIDTDALIGANAAMDEVYFWEHNTSPSPTFPGANSANFNMEDISVRNVGAGVAASTGGTAPGQFMSTGQGFAFKAATADAVTFNNTMRVTGNNADLRNPIVADRLWLNVTSNEYGLGSNMAIVFTDQATAGYEAAFDSQRLGTIVSLYSQIEGSDNGYTIQGREAFTSGASVTTGFSSLVDENTSYTVNMTNRDGGNMETASIFLIDNELNTVTDLTLTSYTFESAKGNFPGRFTVVFENESLNTADNALTAVSMYPNPSSDIVNIASPNAAISLIEVTDIRGRVVLTEVVSAQNTATINVATLDSAVYLVTITTDRGSITNRLIKE